MNNSNHQENIRVVARVRRMPLEIESSIAVDHVSSSIRCTDGKKTKTYKFDHVFDPSASQALVYEKSCADLVQTFLEGEGFNVSIFACEYQFLAILSV